MSSKEENHYLNNLIRVAGGVKRKIQRIDAVADENDSKFQSVNLKSHILLTHRYLMIR